MITIEGKSVFGGVSIGKLMFYKRNEKVIRRTHVDDVDAEWKRFEEAKNTAIDQLKVLYDKAIEDVGEANAMIFEIHQMMLDDLDYLESIEGIIRTQNVNAEYAVSTTADNFAQMFASMDDAYMQGRAADVKDVSERVLDILCGVSNGTREMTEPCIVAADDLAPSETVQLDKEKVLGFATMYGSSNSHTAILARTMNIPAVIGMGEALNPKYDGEMAIIDGFTGTLYVDPDEETLAKMQEKRAKDLEQKELLNQLKGKENVTKSGQKINVYANIGNVSDLGAVLKNDAGGVGLFRSEFLYLENSTYPTEEQQFAAYKQVVESMAGKKVIIRTLDIGADKQVDYFNDIKDEIKLKSGDALDLKYYDPAMRQLIDNYVRAEDSEKLVDLADISFLDLIDTQGDKAIDSLPKKIKQNERSVAEILAANMRKMIISERPNNPAYFDKMSDLLNHLLQEQKDGKIQYKELIKKLIEKLKEARSTIKTKYPATIDTKGKQALYDNLGKDETLALRVHETIKANARDGFRDMDSSGLKKMKALRRAVERVLQGVEVNIDDIMQLIVAQREY